MDRHLAAGERLDLLRQDVPRDHLMAELGEAGGGHQPDPTGSDHSDGFAFAHSPSLPFLAGFFFGRMTWQDSAIPIICSLVSDCCRLFEIQ